MSGENVGVSGGSSPVDALGALPLARGTRLRQYILQETLGAGGFGITYRARHEMLTSKSFAIKEYYPRGFCVRDGTSIRRLPGERDIFGFGLARFLQEAEILARCPHPAIVDVVDYFEENGTAYAVLGHVEGAELGRWLAGLGRPPSQAELDRIVSPLLDALEAMHAKGLLHRDIAPDNILVKSDGTPCLIDFGAAKAELGAATRSMAGFVKSGYSPPEQYLGHSDHQGPWTDIYALGATLYRAVVGNRPPEAVERSTLGRSMPSTAAASRGAYRRSFLVAIDHALALAPEARPQSIAPWRAELLRHDALVVSTEDTSADNPATRATEPATATADRSATAATSKDGAWRVSWIVGAVLVIGLIGGSVWWRSTREPATAVSHSPRPPVSTTAASGWDPVSGPDGAIVPASPGDRPSGPSAGSTAPAPPETPPPELAQVRANCAAGPTPQRIAACTHLTTVAGLEVGDRARAFVALGQAHRTSGDSDAALAALDEAIRLAPGSADAYTHRGIAFLDKGQHDRAIAEFGEAIARDPAHAEAHNNRAWTFFRSGRAAQGLADAERAVALSPETSYVWDTRGHIYEAIGRRDDAIRDFRKAIELDPGLASRASREGLVRLGVAP